MSYMGRKDQFVCDTCRKVENVSNGLPKGWCYIKTGGTIAHACRECRNAIPKERQFESGQK